MQNVKKLAKGDLVTREWLASISDAIGELQKMAITGAQFPLTIAPGGTLMSAIAENIITAKITAVTAGASGESPKYTFRRGSWDSISYSTQGTWTEDTGAVDEFGYSPDPKTPPMAVDDYIWAIPRGIDSDGTVYYSVIGRDGDYLIPVSLTVDDGSGTGDSTTAATITYKNPTNLITGTEIKNADGSSATALSPAWQRPIGLTLAGSQGTVYINRAGDPSLFQVDEVPDNGACDGSAATPAIDGSV